MGFVLLLLVMYSLRPMEGAFELAMGSVLMLFGVLCGWYLHGKANKMLLVIGLAGVLAVLLFAQYFAAGFLVYNACAMIFSKNLSLTSKNRSPNSD